MLAGSVSLEQSKSVSVNGNRMARVVRAAVCQLMPSGNKALNLENAGKAIQNAVKAGANFVCLPECFNCPYGNEYFPEFAEEIPGETSRFLSQTAQQQNIVLVGGSIPERDADKLYNTSLVYGPDGGLLAKHRKVHLFDIDVPGKIRFIESETLTRGDSITCFDTDFGRVGLAICYDLRFPLLAMAMRQRGCSILVYPGAFNTTTGPMHWELLVRARAVDTQSYVVAASVARDPEATYPAWGHSMIVGPWGDIKASMDESEGAITADMDLGEIDAARTSIAVSKQMRSDLYELHDLKKS